MKNNSSKEKWCPHYTNNTNTELIGTKMLQMGNLLLLIYYKMDFFSTVLLNMIQISTLISSSPLEGKGHIENYASAPKFLYCRPVNWTGKDHDYCASDLRLFSFFWVFACPRKWIERSSLNYTLLRSMTGQELLITISWMYHIREGPHPESTPENSSFSLVEMK